MSAMSVQYCTVVQKHGYFGQMVCAMADVSSVTPDF
jgi:hypothetical protein